MNKRRIRYTFLYTLAIFIFNPWSLTAFAADFFFGNHIDTHQETKIKLKKGDPDSLKGSLYIIFTGEIDSASGYPIARHPRGADHDEVCGVNAIKCEVGWKIKAVPGSAKFLYHSGVNGDDHPVWMVNRVDIPQPSSFTHFHWITWNSTDPRAATVPEECDVETAGELDNNAEDIVCPGWFLEIKANKKKFAFEHGNEVVPVRKGIDNATHLNLVTNYRADLEIERSRPNEP
jgi:hypothetical protein